MRRWWILWILLGLQASAAETPTPGHRRMVESLARVARDTAQNNPFLGENGLTELESALAALGAGDPVRRWGYHRAIGASLLRLGRIDDALEHYREAYSLVSSLGGPDSSQPLIETAYELAIAYMRLGETQNCALRHTADSCILPIRDGGIHIERTGSEQAMRYFGEVLAGTPTNTELHLRARWLFNIAAMTLGLWPDQVAAPDRIGLDTFRSDQSFPRFVDIAPPHGLNSFDLAGGAIGEDFDGDGDLDLMVSTSDTRGQMRYYENTGAGRFTERTAESGLTGLVGGLNLKHADYDNDGDPDVIVLRGGWWAGQGKHPNSLLRNDTVDGKVTFTDVTFDAGLGEEHYPTQTAAWADYDNDGDLDLYVGNEQAEIRAPGQLFNNNGDGTFSDVAARAGVTNDGFAKGVAWGDYDGDRFPDLYVSNMGHDNRLYRNNADGTFTDVAGQLGVENPITGFATWFWDYDNDGVLDLFVASYGGDRQRPDVAAVAASFLGVPHRAELDHLYRGDGEGGFDEVARAVGLTQVTLPMGSNHGDLDYDGFSDFYLGTGYPRYEALMPNVMYRNVGGTAFKDVTTAGGFGHLQKGHGVVFGDFDGDGDQDVFEQLGGAYPGDAFSNALFDNPGHDNHWIKVDLVGVRTNRSAIGARIRVEIDVDGRRRTIHRHVDTGGSFGSNPLRQEIGLGSADRVALLEVYWPTSGHVDRLRDLDVDRVVKIVEGSP